MTTLVQDNAKQITALCRKYRVESLSVFGSVLHDDFSNHNSDIDFLVRFAPLTPTEKTEAYFGLLESLETLFGRKIDLVMSTALKNPYIADEINRSKEALYAA